MSNPRYIQVTSQNLKDVAEDLMMDPTILAIQYMQAKNDGKLLIFELHEEAQKPKQSFADRFNEDISDEH